MAGNRWLGVRQMRLEPPNALDFFPTPPWATRSLLEHVLRPRSAITFTSCVEPAAGQGHMAEVLREYFDEVRASDIHDYGAGYPVRDAITDGGFLDQPTPVCGWWITNPPFNKAMEFALQGLDLARHGVALLCRTPWTESIERYEGLFRERRPSVIAQFVERVPMHKGRWVVNGATTTAYAWFVWFTSGPYANAKRTEYDWIPPGRREALTKPDDAARFGGVYEEGQGL